MTELPVADETRKAEEPKHGAIRRRQILLSLLLVITILPVYWPVFRYPYIQDDWLILHRLIFSGTSDFFLAALSPFDRVFYRPVGEMMFLGINTIFGVNPIGFHIVGLILHAATSLLLVRLVLRLTGSDAMGWGAGWLYASSATVHLEPLLWLVGMYELIAAFCVVGAVLAFVQERRVLSSALFAVGLLTKEAAIIMFPILILLALVYYTQKGVSHLLKRLLPYALIALGYMGLKVLGTSPLGLASGHPYTMQLTGGHIKDNAISYAAWAAEALIPFKILGHSAQTMNLFVMIPAIVCVVAFVLAVFGKDRRGRSRLLIFLVGWTAIGILPVLFLPNQLYKYYLTYSLMPLAVLVILVVVDVGEIFRWAKRLVPLGVGVFCLACALGSMMYVLGKDAQGYQEGKTSHSRGGENHLIRKGSIVMSVQSSLRQIRPTLPPGSVLVFKGVDTRVFGESAGPQIWYGDSTLMVYEAYELRIAWDGLHIKDRENNSRVLPTDRLAVFGFSDGVLREIVMDEIQPLHNGG